MNIIGANDQAILEALSGDVQADDVPGGFAGLGETSVTTLVTSNITCAITAYLRPDRLMLGAACTVDLCRVEDLKVGSISLNIGSSGAAAKCFAHDAVGSRLRAAVTASPAVPPVVRFYNGTAGTIKVEGAIFGPVTRA
jgi:hypothetical protein